MQQENYVLFRQKEEAKRLRKMGLKAVVRKRRLSLTSKNLNGIPDKQNPKLDDESLTKKMFGLLKSIKARCTNKNLPAYKYYGGKGIRCLLNIEDLKSLWLRDNAHLFEKASIDRTDSDGHYELTNCSFMELRHNSMRIKRSNTTNSL